MPTFTENEKVHIREQLLAAGRELFPRYGLKKTSLEDLDAAGGHSEEQFLRLLRFERGSFIMEILMEDASGRLRGPRSSAASFEGRR